MAEGKKLILDMEGEKDCDCSCVPNVRDPILRERMFYFNICNKWR